MSIGTAIWNPKFRNSPKVRWCGICIADSIEIFLRLYGGFSRATLLHKLVKHQTYMTSEAIDGLRYESDSESQPLESVDQDYAVIARDQDRNALGVGLYLNSDQLREVGVNTEEVDAVKITVSEGRLHLDPVSN